MTKRAILYVRVSKNRDDDAAKPDRQIDSCRHLCAAKGFDIVAEPLVDDDVSAYKGKTKRPGYLTALEMVSNDEADVVVCWHIDRLLRTTREMLDFIELAEATGVSLESVQGGSLDLATPAGKMVATILSAVAQQEVELKSQRHILKNQQARAAGKSTGGPVPFGWDLGERTAHGRTFIINEMEAAQLRSATAGIIDGTKSLYGIASEWNALGSTTTFGKPWTHTGVRKVLVRPRNAGLVDHRGEVLEGITADHEPIVSRETWQAAMDILNSRPRPRTTKRSHVMSGLVHCARCGRPLTAGKSVVTVKGKKYVYDVLKHFAKDRGCGLTIREAMTEEKVFRHVRFLLTTTDVEQLAPSDLDLSKAAALRLEVARIELKMRELEELWIEGEFSKDNYRKQRATLSETQDAASEGLVALERDNAFAGMLDASMGRVSFTDAAKVGDRFAALPLEHKRVIIRTLFPRIEVSPGKGADRVRTYRPDGTEFAFDEPDGL